MNDAEAPAPGLLTALRHLSASLLETARVRLALLGNELEFEKLRLSRSLMAAALALLFIAAALVMFSLFVVLLLGDAYRIWTLGALTLIYLGAGLWLWRRAGAELKHAGGPFASSLAELDRDTDALRDTP
jgi:uncharacterized membrane protein YqjE